VLGSYKLDDVRGRKNRGGGGDYLRRMVKKDHFEKVTSKDLRT